MITNSTLFDRLVAETQTLSPAPINPISKGKLKRWDDLAAYWEANPAAFPNLFYEAIFHIARDRYSKAPVSLKPLLRLIEEALLTDLDALCTWRKRHAFECAFQHVTGGITNTSYSNQRWKSIVMRYFIEDKLLTLLIYRGKPIPQLTLKLIRNRKAYWSLRRQMETESSYACFVKLIELLVPDSRNWGLGQWASEKFIFSQIKAIHGVDFALHTTDFNALVFMFKNKAEGFPYYKNLFAIKNLSVSIARAIWGVNMEHEICKQFNIACTVRPWLKNGKFRKYDPIYPLNMTNSWAFQQMVSWRKAKSEFFTSKIKSKMFHISLGDHPWNINHGLPTVA